MYLYIYLDWIITLYSKVYFHILRLNCLMLPPSWYRRVQVARHWRSTMCIIGWWAVPKCHELFSQCLYDLGPFSAVIYIIYIYIAPIHTLHTMLRHYSLHLGPRPKPPPLISIDGCSDFHGLLHLGRDCAHHRFEAKVLEGCGCFGWAVLGGVPRMVITMGCRRRVNPWKLLQLLLCCLCCVAVFDLKYRWPW